MANEVEYYCNGCRRPTPRSDLKVKKVLFTGMGKGAYTARARVVAWLCEPCLDTDLDWNRPERVQPSERVYKKELEDIG